MTPVYLFGFAASFIAAVVLVPVSNVLAKRFGIVDRPARRKMNFRPLTRWGGFGSFLAFIAVLGIMAAIFPSFRVLLAHEFTFAWGGGEETVRLGGQLAGILVAAVIIVIVGTVDDRRGIPPLVKLLFQVIAAFIALDYGVRIIGFSVPFSDRFIVFPRFVSQAVTVLWLCGFMNMVNLADGVDGLAAGIVAICGFAFFVISLLQQQAGVAAEQMKLSAVLATLLTGSAAGFLVYNFFPAKLFMGDTGALFFGLIIGCITTVGVLKTGAVVAFVIPVLVIGIPFVDVVLAVLRRVRAGTAIGQADRSHLHHLLLRSDWTPREVTLLFYVITLLLAITVITFVALKAKL